MLPALLVVLLLNGQQQLVAIATRPLATRSRTMTEKNCHGHGSSRCPTTRSKMVATILRTRTLKMVAFLFHALPPIGQPPRSALLQLLVVERRVVLLSGVSTTLQILLPLEMPALVRMSLPLGMPALVRMLLPLALPASVRTLLLLALPVLVRLLHLLPTLAATCVQVLHQLHGAPQVIIPT